MRLTDDQCRALLNFHNTRWFNAAVQALNRCNVVNVLVEQFLLSCDDDSESSQLHSINALQICVVVDVMGHMPMHAPSQFRLHSFARCVATLHF